MDQPVRSPEGGAATAAVKNRRPPALPVPAVVKRNLTLFTLSICFTGAGMQFAYGFGPLMVEALTGSTALAGLSVALIGLSRSLISYPMGHITDHYGRKPGVLLGLSVAMGGAVVLGMSMVTMSFAVFVIGLLIFGAGMNGAQQLRVAATDMVPPFMRGTALGYLSLGALLGLITSPIVTSFAEDVGRYFGTHILAFPWFLLPLIILPGIAIISFVRPDPKYIGMNLKEFYPDYVPLPPPRAKPSDGAPAEKFGMIQVMKNPPVMLAIVSNASANGNMSIVMVLTSLVLAHHGYTLTEIALSHMFHSMGMFAFTVPLGWLTDRIGRTRVMYPGVFVALLGSSLVSHTDGSYWLVTLGTFLVGLGWAAANVSAIALIADHYETVQRGRAVGVNESIAGAVSVVMAMVTGPLIYWSGLPATGLAAMLLAGVPFALWIALRMTGTNTR